MAKLHELLAAESNLRSQAETCRADLKNTFEKKRTHLHFANSCDVMIVMSSVIDWKGCGMALCVIDQDADVKRA